MANRYWVGGTGTWNASDTTHWSATSGGVAGASAPIAGDVANVDFNSSISGGTISLGSDIEVGSIAFQTVDPVSFTFNTNNFNITTINDGSDISSVGFYWRFYGTANVLNAGTSTISIQNGGNFKIENGGDTREIILNLDSATITLSNGGVFGLDAAFSSQTLNLSLITGTIGTLNFLSGAYGFWYSGAPSATITNLNISAGTSVQFLGDGTYNATYTIGNITANGTSGNLITFSKTGSGNAKLSASSVSLSYISVSGNTALGSASPFPNSNGTDGGSNLNWIFNPVANFTGTPLSGSAPLQVVFTDSSTNTPTSWAWDFMNDGVATSTSQNPTYRYKESGVYTVSMTATNAAGSNTKTRLLYVTVTAHVMPTYNTSLISAVTKVQQNQPSPQFVIGGRNSSTYKLFKKSSTGTFHLWRSRLYQIGTDFDVMSIVFNLVTDLDANTEIYPILYFDDSATSSIGTVITNENYSNTNKLITLTAANFNNAVHGKSNFFLEFQFTGSSLAVIDPHIQIVIEQMDT